jgi:hypothetical protein
MTNYFYHSSHGEIILNNPIIDVNSETPIKPLQGGLPGQKIEIIVLNRAAMGHVIRAAALTIYGDVNRNFNPDLFEDYMKITAVNNEIIQIIVAAGGVVSDIFYDKSKNIKKPLPNIEFSYNDDFNMGTFELTYDGTFFTPTQPGVNVWDNLCISKPENPTKIDYLHDENDSLINKMITSVNEMHEIYQMMDVRNEEKPEIKNINIVLFNSTCLHIENAPNLYEAYPDWGRLFNIYLQLGQKKLADQHQRKVEQIDKEVINTESKLKKYDEMKPKDPGEAEKIMYDKEKYVTNLDKLKKKRERQMQKRLRRTIQSTKMFDLMNRDKIKPIKTNIYRRPQKTIFKRQFGGINFKNIVTVENYKNNLHRPIKFIGKFNKIPLTFYDVDKSGICSLEELYDYQKYDNLVIKNDRKNIVNYQDGYIPIGKQTENNICYVRVPTNIYELKKYLNGNLENIPDNYYHFEYINKYNFIKNKKTYKKIKNYISNDIGQILFENLKI